MSICLVLNTLGWKLDGPPLDCLGVFLGAGTLAWISATCQSLGHEFISQSISPVLASLMFMPSLRVGTGSVDGGGGEMFLKSEGWRRDVRRVTGIGSGRAHGEAGGDLGAAFLVRASSQVGRVHPNPRRPTAVGRARRGVNLFFIARGADLLAAPSTSRHLESAQPPMPVPPLASARTLAPTRTSTPARVRTRMRTRSRTSTFALTRMRTHVQNSERKIHNATGESRMPNAHAHTRTRTHTHTRTRTRSPVCTCTLARTPTRTRTSRHNLQWPCDHYSSGGFWSSLTFPQ